MNHVTNYVIMLRHFYNGVRIGETRSIDNGRAH